MSAEPEHFDAVVVGSGFGGSVVTHRLAAAGWSVLLLERGQPYPPGAFPRTPNQLRGAFWDPSAGLYGMFDEWEFDALDAVVASGLGGGSLVYANVMLRKDERTFVVEDLDAGGYESWPVTRADLEPHYDNVERMQAPRRFPLEAGRAYRAVHKPLAMLEAGKEMRLSAELPPLAVLFGEDGEAPRPSVQVSDGSDNLHGVPRSSCRLCGECDVGCNAGAKNTLDLTYLSHAARAGAQIRTCCEVRTITAVGGEHGGYRVGYRQHLSVRDGHEAHLIDPVPEPGRTVTAGTVVLSAGAVATPHLLLSNRAGIPGLSPALGTRVSGNGDYLGWVRNTRRKNGSGDWRYLDPSSGPVITASIEVSDAESPCGRGFVIQDAGAPAFADWIWQLTELPGDAARELPSAVRRLVDRLRGRRDTHASAAVARLLGDAHASAAMMPLLGMGRDIPNGRYRLRGRRLELDWDLAQSGAYFDAMREGMRDLARALGGEFVHDPLDRRGRAISVHMVGGCPMATQPAHGVVDPFGRVYNHPKLWIADGSVMPGPVGVNPSFTIAALADRTAEAILGR